VHNEILGRLQEMFPGRVAPMVRENVAVAEAPAHGMPVTLYAPKSNGAQDYRKVVRWFREQLQV
jgi:cellulose biosynthesis protein BcsQ